MFLFLDCETSGLDPDHDLLCEVAWFISNHDLTFPKGGIQAETHVVHPGLRTWARLAENDFVTEMHSKTGLWDEMQQITRGAHDGLMASDIEEIALDYLDEHVPEGEPVHLAGSSPQFDMGFLKVHMPRLAERFHHRFFDVSTLVTFFESLGIEHGVVNPMPHRALNDIQEDLAIAQTYRHYVHPGHIQSVSQGGLRDA